MKKIDRLTALKIQRIRRKRHEYQRKHHALYLAFKNRGRLDLYRLIKAGTQWKKVHIRDSELVKPKRASFWELLIKKIRQLCSKLFATYLTKNSKSLS